METDTHILIVEDDAAKLARIEEVLKSVSGCPLKGIHSVRDIISAKRALRDTRYDLLILDIAVPQRQGDQATADAGMNLLDEIVQRESLYKVPQHIVGLTAHEEVLAKANKHFEKELWTVMQYRESHMDWQEKLRGRLSHILQAGSSARADESASILNHRKSTVESLVQQGEGDHVEFKSTLRWNKKSGRDDAALELSVLKTIAAFFNTKGGTLLIGVSDAGEVLGIQEDHFGNDDKAVRHLISLVRTRISNEHTRYLSVTVEGTADRVMRVDCSKARKPAYVRTDKGEVFYIRTGPASCELPISELLHYVETWF